MPRPERLRVWVYDTEVAELTTNGRPGHVACRYTDAARARWEDGTPVLSCSLLLQRRTHRQAGHFFRGLLAEGAGLSSMASIAGVPTYDTYSLLDRFGRDVAGALVIAREPVDDNGGEAVPYSPAELAAEVASLDDHPLALHEDSELSLPGLQNKMTLIATSDGWARPVGGRPSTHILKVEDRRFPGMAAAEADCLRLARRLNLTSVDVAELDLDGIACVVVSRYDRAVDDGGKVMRVHQEDACQAAGVDATANRGRGKYEHAGGPSLVRVAGLLDRYALDGVAALETLLALVTFTVCIGNADAHGKNVGFLHHEDGGITLAPAYDTVPTALWPRLPRRPGMYVGDCADITRVSASHLLAEAQRWPLSESRARAVIGRTAEAAREGVTAILRGDELAAYVVRTAGKLLDGLASVRAD